MTSKLNLTTLATQALTLVMMSAAALTSQADSHGANTTVAAIVASAEVVAIDRADRHITLVGPRGDVVEIEAGEEVRN